MIQIVAVDPHSIGAELGLEAGDRLLTVNGRPVRDLLDFQVYAAGVEELLLEVEKEDGELWDLEFERDADDDLGLHFEHPEPTQCGNNCIFCFVHQLPPGMRSSLYLKDEDFRFSYLYGAYVTLTNIDEEEIERILDQRLSPLYVSVHATDEELRTRLIGRPGLPILDLLRRLTAGGIEIHTQIVLCPGINDGVDLDRTVADLFALHPGIRSLAVVPVGLTGFRRRLPTLRTPTAAEARQAIARIERFQGDFLSRAGTRFVFAADELYLRGGVDFPPLADYEDLAQLENGVGLIPLFRAEAAEALAAAEALDHPPVATFTGESFAGELASFLARLEEKTTVPVHLYPVKNHFFGGEVTVAGLLTGADVLAQLRGRELGAALLVPDVVLREGAEVFLDDVSLEQLERELGVPVHIMPNTPRGLLELLEDLADARALEREQEE